MTSTTAPPALTTTFVAEDWCTGSIYGYQDIDAACVEGTAAVACGFLQLGATTSTSACFPPDYQIDRSFYYSPGVCPSGYSLACSNTVGSETQGTCCPIKFACNTETDGWPWYSTDQCTWPIPATITYIYQTSTVGGKWETNTATGGGQAAANALGIAIRYRKDDFVSKTSISSRSKSASSSSGPSSSNTGTIRPEPAPSSGLSTGVKAGIAVGAVVVALIALGLVLFYVRRRRKSGVAGEGYQSGMAYYGGVNSQVVQAYGPPGELEGHTKGKNPYNQQIVQRRPDMYDGHTPSELE